MKSDFGDGRRFLMIWLREMVEKVLEAGACLMADA
jgi:hypothetical protein